MSLRILFVSTALLLAASLAQAQPAGPPFRGPPIHQGGWQAELAWSVRIRYVLRRARGLSTAASAAWADGSPFARSFHVHTRTEAREGRAHDEDD